jgi:2-polyprenyl-3-methyl-5-hydroxy-6-metoxy-1,4-benzoquinol methylase
MTRPNIRRNFDRDFYERYYGRRASAVATEEDAERLARFLLSYLGYLGVRVRTVLDAGCGVGMLGRALDRLDKDIEYFGTDPSEYLCNEYGWAQNSIAEFKSRRRFDLIVCRDVLQYVTDKEVRTSIDNIARHCRGSFYLDVPTKDDFDEGLLDERKTDPRIRVRSAAWYRRRVDPHFQSVGGGLFIPRDSDTVVLALERG